MKKFIIFSVACIFFASVSSVLAQGNQPIPPKGSIFNESVWMVDSVTGRPTLRLTQNRDFNRVPSYHLNACFSGDSRYIIFSTASVGYGSALIQADVTNGDCRVIATRGIKETGFNDVICMVPRSDYAACSSGKKLRIYNLKTLDESTIYECPKGKFISHPTASCDGKKMYIGQLPLDKNLNRMSIIEIEIATGKSKQVFADTSWGKHLVANPVYPDLLLIDRDFPPKFSHGSDRGKTTRVWILNVKTGALVECRPNNPARFQGHCNWSHDGKYVYYHGLAKNNTHYIGVTDLDGKVVWENTFPFYHYGHIFSHMQKHALFTDGLLFPNLITELEWTKPDKYNVPPIVIYGAHNSSWGVGQHAHPHCHMSPDAQKVAYNKGSQTHSDVYILFIGK